MTKRLYYTDSYLCDFDAEVTEITSDRRRIYLDRTAFYPTSGGQPHDVGSIDGVAVVDVIDEAERVAHLLAEPLPCAAGDRVAAVVDGGRRFDHMQQHSGQHLLSAIFTQEFGLATVSVHFGADYSTLDLGVESIGVELLREAELRANEAVARDLPVHVSFEDADRVQGLRRESKRSGELRIVEIDGLDRSACGGTHVRATGEIGAVLLRKVDRIRKDTRIEFLCGARAIRRARADFDALSEIARQFSGSIDDVPRLVAGQREELRGLLGSSRKLEEELGGYRAKSLYDEVEPDAAGVRRLVRRTEGAAADLTGLAVAFTCLPKTVFVGLGESPATLLVAAAEDSGLDAGVELKRLIANTGGRGGGNARIAQARLPDADAIVRVLAAMG